jgi:uncharacterized protein YijF (DUF1287 family)
MEKPDLEKERKEAFNRYLKSWKKKNPDKAKAINIRYWTKRALRELELSKQATDGSK